MEVAGFVFGAVSVITLWQTCVQAFDIVTSGQRYGVDSEIAHIKLEVERVRLLMWGQAVGLADGQRLTTGTSSAASSPSSSRPLDPRLNTREVGDAVTRILGCIQLLFKDTGALQRRYGLQREYEASSLLPNFLTRSPSSTNVLDSIFIRAYASLQKSSKNNQAGLSLRRRARWAIVDKNRFDILISEIRGFNDSLGALFPEVLSDTKIKLREEIEASDEVGSLRLLQQASATDYAELSDTASHRLTSLEQRASGISDAWSSPLLDDGFVPSMAKMESISEAPSNHLEMDASSDDARWHFLFRDDSDRGVTALQTHVAHSGRNAEWLVNFVAKRHVSLLLYIQQSLTSSSRQVRAASRQARRVEYLTGLLATGHDLRQRCVTLQNMVTHICEQTRQKQRTDIVAAQAREEYEAARYRIATLERELKYAIGRDAQKAARAKLQQGQQSMDSLKKALFQKDVEHKAVLSRWDDAWRKTCDYGQILEHDIISFAKDFGLNAAEQSPDDDLGSHSAFMVSVDPVAEAIAIGTAFRTRADLSDDADWDDLASVPAPIEKTTRCADEPGATFADPDGHLWDKGDDKTATKPSNSTPHVPPIVTEAAPVAAITRVDSAVLEPHLPLRPLRRLPTLADAPSPPRYHAAPDAARTIASKMRQEVSHSHHRNKEQPLLPGLYRALYDFRPEDPLEMALSAGDMVRVVGGGGFGWATVSRDASDVEGEHALVPKAYLRATENNGDNVASSSSAQARGAATQFTSQSSCRRPAKSRQEVCEQVEAATTATATSATTGAPAWNEDSADPPSYYTAAYDSGVLFYGMHISRAIA
ncbi:prion-inhibition and propagation-domain-containing protein [Schizophyllum amplum]|uniref:Prion-inhibition and propagation-domain-containing protein n=1 Tax=Schizophyllum amplum TaxID=97359 RepID=A0A550C4W9_9AGAR|nr:prion-inhibition and propagation-domain-containing protein [Auriculariopsis ampla]